MYTYLNRVNLVVEQRNGFRKLHSPEYAVVNVIDHVTEIKLRLIMNLKEYI